MNAGLSDGGRTAAEGREVRRLALPIGLRAIGAAAMNDDRLGQRLLPI
jgi:hypothetical protein